MQTQYATDEHYDMISLHRLCDQQQSWSCETHDLTCIRGLALLSADQAQEQKHLARLFAVPEGTAASAGASKCALQGAAAMLKSLWPVGKQSMSGLSHKQCNMFVDSKMMPCSSRYAIIPKICLPQLKLQKQRQHEPKGLERQLHQGNTERHSEAVVLRHMACASVLTLKYR